MLLTTKHILRIYHNSNNDNCDEVSHFRIIYQNLIHSPLFKNIRIEVLFQNFEERIEVAKNIAINLTH